MALAAFLGVQSVWFLLAELSRSTVTDLPAEVQVATAAAKQRGDATWAAWIGGIRGDLWAEAAFTYSDLLWTSNGADSTGALAQARTRLDRAVDYAPHQAGAWLLFAGLASRYRWSDVDATEALKMSYYTGPSEDDLMVMRLRVAASLEMLGDSEVQQLARRDLRLLLARRRELAVAEAYNNGSPAGRRFIEQAVGEIDPSVLGSLRAGVRKP